VHGGQGRQRTFGVVETCCSALVDVERRAALDEQAEARQEQQRDEAG
jgi:hypothetical protein